MPDPADKLKRLVGVATQMVSTFNLDELLQLVMATAAELLEAESGSLLLLDEETNELIFRIASAEPQLVGHRMPAQRGIAGDAIQQRTAVVISDTSTDERFYDEVDKALGTATRSLIAVPLLVDDKALGVIEVMNKRQGSFTADDEELAVALAGLAAVAISNASIYQHLADAVLTARMSYRL